MSNDLKFKKFINGMAYFALVFVAIALCLSFIFKNNTGVIGTIANVLNEIARALAFIVTAIAGFYFARSKRNAWWMVIYVIAVIVMVVFFIVPLF